MNPWKQQHYYEWITIEILWSKNAHSLGSPVTALKRAPSSLIRANPFKLISPIVSHATGQNIWVEATDAYSAHLRTLANSAAAQPDLMTWQGLIGLKCLGLWHSKRDTFVSALRDQCLIVRPPTVRKDKTMGFLWCRDISLGECPEDNIVDEVMPCDPPDASAAWQPMCPSCIHHMTTRAGVWCAKIQTHPQTDGYPDSLVVQTQAEVGFACNRRYVVPGKRGFLLCCIHHWSCRLAVWFQHRWSLCPRLFVQCNSPGGSGPVYLLDQTASGHKVRILKCLCHEENGKLERRGCRCCSQEGGRCEQCNLSRVWNLKQEEPKYGTNSVPWQLFSGRGTKTSKYGTSRKIQDIWQA